ncbi:hypothetical protein IJU97_02775, partial [bacterium]|nr:hypothetical protein [bacterium]
MYAKVLNNTATTEEIEKLEELSLWRDKQLEEFSDIEIRYQHIIKTVLPYIQTILQLCLKNPNVSAEVKGEILMLR